MSDQQQAKQQAIDYQREIHIDLVKLKEFLLSEDRETQMFALESIGAILGAHMKNTGEIYAKINEMLVSNSAQVSALLLESEVPEQILLVGILANLARPSSTCPDLAVALMETAIYANNPTLRKDAGILLKKYIENDVNRAAVMRALAADSELGITRENADLFRKVAACAIGHTDAYESALRVLMNVAGHTEVRMENRESALLEVGMQFFRGTDISCVENSIRGLAKNREGVLFKNAKSLLESAEMRGFNRPEKGFAKMPSAQPGQVAPLQLRRAVA